MVIQRIQTVWLLVALVFIVLIGVLPLATLKAGSSLFVTDLPVLIVVDVLIGVLLFMSIFLFKNLKLQKKVTLLSMVMMVVLGVVSAFFIYRTSPDAEIEWTGAILMLLGSLVFAYMAYQGMARDERKLKASDSLWR